VATPAKQLRVHEPDPAQVSVVEAELTRIRAELTTSEKETKRLEEELDVTKTERDTLKTLKDDAEEVCRTTKTELLKTRDELDVCTGKLNDATKECDTLKEGVERANANMEFFRKNAESVTMEMEAVRQKVRAMSEGLSEAVQEFGIGLDFVVQSTLMDTHSKGISEKLHTLLVRNNGFTSDQYLSLSIMSVGMMIEQNYPNGALAKLANVCELVDVRGVAADIEVERLRVLCESQEDQLMKTYALSLNLDEARVKIRDMQIGKGLMRRYCNILKYKLFTLEYKYIKLVTMQRDVSDLNFSWLAAFDGDCPGGEAGADVKNDGVIGYGSEQLQKRAEVDAKGVESAGKEEQGTGGEQ
jgi:hypothetical protein